MCCCAEPNVNGEPGYSWDGKAVGVRPVDPPALADGDELLFDEPGRCGGMDSHCHHYRLVKNYGFALLVRHGGGDERVRLSLPRGTGLDGPEWRMSSDTRYWMLNAMYHAHSEGRRSGRDATARTYADAFVDGRLKKRKQRGGHSVKVWIEPAALASTEAH